MLSALVAVELFDGGGRYAVDWRTLAGVAAGVVALLLRRASWSSSSWPSP